MNLHLDFMSVVQRRWTMELLLHTPRSDAVTRLLLLESDLESLRIALEDYLAAKHEVNANIAATADSGQQIAARRKAASSRMFHNAKVFVVCMRRFARLLEAAKSRKHEYPHEVGEALDLAWKKTKAFFANYLQARNAIEHIDGEVNGYNRRFINLRGDYLEVVDGKSAHITPTALDTVERAWAGIVEVILRPVEARVRVALMKRFLTSLQTRVECLTNLDIANNRPSTPNRRRR